MNELDEGGVALPLPFLPLPLPSVEKISLVTVQGYRAGESVSVYLPGLPMRADISCALTSNRSRGPQ